MSFVVEIRDLKINCLNYENNSRADVFIFQIREGKILYAVDCMRILCNVSLKSSRQATTLVLHMLYRCYQASLFIKHDNIYDNVIYACMCIVYKQNVVSDKYMYYRIFRRQRDKR